MGVQRVDTIGIINFVIYVPIILIACFIILRLNVIAQKLKEIVNFADKELYYYITLIVTIVLIFVSIILYMNSVYSLQQSYLLGEKMQKNCGNNYSIYNTANYQLYSSIKGPENPIYTANVSCIILYIVVGLVFLSIFIDNYLHFDKSIISNPILRSYLYIYPLIGIIFVSLFGGLRLFRDMMQPNYIVGSKVFFPLFPTYIFIVICFGIQFAYYGKIMQPFSFILLCISLLALLLIYFTQTSNLVESVNDYEKRVNTTIVKDINNIAQTEKDNTLDGTDLTSYSNMPYPPNTDFTQYIMANMKAVPKWNNNIPPNNEPLWPYVLNQSNGMELENLYKDPSQKENILTFRKDMATLRSFTEPADELNTFSFRAYFILLLIIVLVVYPIFNMLYKNDSVLISYLVAIGIILILCICCIVGFISKLLP